MSENTTEGDDTIDRQSNPDTEPGTDNSVGQHQLFRSGQPIDPDTEITRTTITIEERLLERAREEDINISEAACNGIRDEVSGRYWMVNSNGQDDDLPDGGLRVMKHGVVATYGPEKYGETLTRLLPGDGGFLYLKDNGVVAFFEVVAPASPSAVPANAKIYPELPQKNEYHASVRYIATVSPDNAFGRDELKDTLGRKEPRHTVEEIKTGDPVALEERLRGRASI